MVFIFGQQRADENCAQVGETDDGRTGWPMDSLFVFKFFFLPSVRA